MALHDDSYVPSVDKKVATVKGFADVAAKAGPTEKGGFVVRITQRAHEHVPASQVYVPLRGLRINGGAPVAQEFVELHNPSLEEAEEKVKKMAGGPYRMLNPLKSPPAFVAMLFLPLLLPPLFNTVSRML